MWTFWTSQMCTIVSLPYLDALIAAILRVMPYGCRANGELKVVEKLLNGMENRL
jgi:hypothetical protein